MTDLTVLKTVDQIMSGYTPVYQPLYPLLIAGKSQQYSTEVGIANFRQVSAVADIRGKHITPKDTEIRQINVAQGLKTYKKYFFANQYIVSQLQDDSDTQDVLNQVLDEYQVQADELLLTGEGTSNSTMLNNGLYWSNDPNYLLESSAVAADNYAFYAKVMAEKAKADQVAGRKLILVYGALTKGYLATLLDSDVPMRSTLIDALGNNYSLSEIPDRPTPSGASGFIIVNMDQIKFHYSALPQIYSRGSNDEKLYRWNNLLMGSMMVEVQAANGIIRQPLTAS